jgi:hypothetical protein
MQAIDVTSIEAMERVGERVNNYSSRFIVFGIRTDQCTPTPSNSNSASV